MPESSVQLPPDLGGKKARTRQRAISGENIEELFLIQQSLEVETFRGRCATFRTPGRAGTTGQKLVAIWNAVGSPVIVYLKEVRIDVVSLPTVAKTAATVPPTIRIHRLTSIPTVGTAGPKTTLDSGTSSSSSVTTYMDASADNVLSTTAMAFTVPANNILSQEYTPRLFSLTPAGYEMADRMSFLDETKVVLRAGEGIGVELNYTVAASNPATDIWTAAFEWVEYTTP